MKSQIKNKKTEEYICWITDTKIMNFHEGETVLSKKCMGWLFWMGGLLMRSWQGGRGVLSKDLYSLKVKI